MPTTAKNVADALVALDKSTDAVLKLGFRYGSEAITQPGVRLTKETVAEAPVVSIAGVDTTKRFLLVLLDLDPPFVSFPVMGPILHWLQPDMIVSSNSSELSTSTKAIWNYIGAAPPAISDPHRYLFLLYEQPEAFNAAFFRPSEQKENSVWARVRWDHDVFEQKAGLGKVIAANYFKVGAK